MDEISGLNTDIRFLCICLVIGWNFNKTTITRRGRPISPSPCRFLLVLLGSTYAQSISSKAIFKLVNFPRELSLLREPGEKNFCSTPCTWLKDGTQFCKSITGFFRGARDNIFIWLDPLDAQLQSYEEILQKFFLLAQKSHFFLNQRRKGRNSSIDSQFFQSELNFRAIKLSYSKSGSTNRSTDMYSAGQKFRDKLFSFIIFYEEAIISKWWCALIDLVETSYVLS